MVDLKLNKVSWLSIAVWWNGVDACYCYIFQAEASAMKLGSTSKNVGSAMAQLLTAASQVYTVDIYTVDI